MTAVPPTPFRLRTNGVTLAGVEAGPRDGPVVLLLHGFPECAFSWRHQVPALAAAGFRAVAPDLRGYGGSSAPAGVRHYDVTRLVGDVLGLLDHFAGPGRPAHVVGHDWGGGLAWLAAMWHPDRVSRLAVLNAPHPAAFAREMRRSWGQRLKSWYMLFFQLPWLPEAMLSWGDFAFLRRTYRTGPARDPATGRPDRAAEDRYVAALARPAALSAAINWYRASARRPPSWFERSFRPIACPTLLLWGDRDAFLSRQLTEDLGQWVPRLTVRHFPAATHWLQTDDPAGVNEALLRFL
ncbi:MAG TPA: alpha/beta fold hydrolase [Humisphaera sp.]